MNTAAIQPRLSTFWATLVIVLGALFVELLAAIVIFGVALAANLTTLPQVQTDPLKIGVYIQTISYLPVLLYLAFVVPYVTGKRWSNLGLTHPSWRAVLLALGAAVIMVLLSDGLGAIISANSHLPVETASGFIHRKSDTLYVATFALMAIVAGPLCEEITFRGVIFNALRTKLPLWPAALISGVIFGAAHLSVGGFLPLAIVGVILAILYARTGNLWASIIAHGCFNAISVLAAMLGLAT